MKPLVIVLGICFVIGVGLFGLNSYLYPSVEIATTTPVMPAPITLPVDVIPISHASVILKWGATALFVDPTGEAEVYVNQPAAQIVLITDIHGDHLSTSTLALVMREGTTLIVPKAVKDMLPKELASRAKVLENDTRLSELGFTITAIPMYNIPESKDAFHTKGRGNGYVIERDNFRVYVAGDTSGTPEMRALDDIDIAFVPMNLPYTMNVEDAADAVLDFKPKQVYPYHYRGPDGLSDVEKFKTLVNTINPAIQVILAKWY